MSAPLSSRLYRFGLFEVDLGNARLTRKGVRIRLQEQPFRILALLLDHPGKIVTREELRQGLWPEGTYVDFDGGLNAALKRLRAALDDEADNPRFIETVPKRGYRFIAPVTRVEPPIELPAAGSASPDLPATNANAKPLGPGEPAHAHPLRVGVAAIAGIILATAVAAILMVHARKKIQEAPAQRASAAPQTDRPSIAVLGFHEVSERRDDAWLSAALSEMLRTELGAGNRLRVVPAEAIAQLAMSSPWSGTDSLSPQTAARIGQALDGDFLVLGSYVTLGGPQDGAIRVDFRLQQARTGQILYEGAESGRSKDLFGLVAKIGVALRERLEIPLVSESEEVGVMSTLPANFEAERFYLLGLEKLANADAAAARDLFLQAAKLAPSFPLVHLMLFRTWGALGYDQKASEEIRTAYKLSTNLPETDKLQVEGAYFESQRKFSSAIAAYRALYTLYPDSVDYGEQLIVELNAAGRREEALAVIQQLRKLPPPASEDPRIDFWQAQLVSSTDPPAARPYFERAISEAASRGQKLLYARFRLAQCINMVYGNHPQGAVAHCQEAYDIFMAAGNRLYAADALRTMADRRGATGDLTGARQIYQRALTILSPLGEHEKTGVVLNNMAITYENQGQIEQAGKLFSRAAQSWKECGDTYDEGIALGNLADIFMARGQLREAEGQYEAARKLIEHLGPANVSYELYSIAIIRLDEGDIAGANRFADQALALSESRKQAADMGASRAILGAIRMAQNNFGGARENFEKALAVAQQLGSKIGIAENQAALAKVSLEQGRPSEAEAAFRKSLAEFESENAALDEIRVETDLSRALLDEGKVEDARRTISLADGLSRSSRDPALKLPLVIERARIEVAQRIEAGRSVPDFSSARRLLQNAIAAAHRLRYYTIESEARLALGEVDLRIHPAQGRAELAKLAKQTHERGLELLSEKAARRIKPSARTSKDSPL